MPVVLFDASGSVYKNPMERMKTSSPQPYRLLVPIFTLTLVTSATLLFWLQPMIAKFILPHVGGAPAVWNTAMMFFQAALLAGYLYAHLLSRHAAPRGQAVAHVTLLLLCVLWLPIGIDPTTAPPAESNPSFWVLATLALGVGLPFTIIAGSAPLLQNWFAASGHRDADNPYFLYGASNIGSMAALFAFPLIAEPLLDLDQQSWAWSLTFGALLALTLISALLARLPARSNRHEDTRPAKFAPSWTDRFLWFVLVMASTSLMLGVTTHITTDVAAVPLLWVVPLALYLLTFIVAFARRPLIDANRSVQLLFIGLVVLGAAWLLRSALGSWLIWAGALLLAFFVIVLSCHSELARLKPHKAWLTEFYLWIALGGVLGGVFNALLAPLLFKGATEFLLMSAAAVTLILSARHHHQGTSPRTMFMAAALCIVVPVGAEHLKLLTPKDVLERHRNFFGVLDVVETQGLNLRVLRYGTTAHGMRDLAPGQDRTPIGYYGKTSPLGDVMRELSSRQKRGDIAAIGLGVGSVACYPRQGRQLTFYEINPTVTAFAEHPDYFGFLKTCGQDYRVVHGDGRLRLNEAPNGQYELLFLDAFSSDSIPVHLITREAFAGYLDKLNSHGLILVHITNRHLDLAPVLASIARDLDLVAFERTRKFAPQADQRDRMVNAQTHMVVLARTAKDLGNLPSQQGWRELRAAPHARTWTDSYSNIVGALRWED